MKHSQTRNEIDWQQWREIFSWLHVPKRRRFVWKFIYSLLFYL